MPNIALKLQVTNRSIVRLKKRKINLTEGKLIKHVILFAFNDEIVIILNTSQYISAFAANIYKV